MSFSGKGQLVGEDVVLIFKNGAMTKPPKASGGGDDDDDDDDEGGGQSSSQVATLSGNAIISLDGRKSGLLLPPNDRTWSREGASLDELAG